MPHQSSGVASCVGVGRSETNHADILGGCVRNCRQPFVRSVQLGDRTA
jgi:hypothetical protein